MKTLVLGGKAQGLAFDHTAPQLTERLLQLVAELVIHTAGPFQEQNYALALAVAGSGAHYIDRADGRRFVCDFAAATHHDFTRAQRTGISGASTVPALSSAVVRHLCQGWLRIDSISTCIAPAQNAPRGEARQQPSG